MLVEIGSTFGGLVFARMGGIKCGIYADENLLHTCYGMSLAILGAGLTAFGLNKSYDQGRMHGYLMSAAALGFIVHLRLSDEHLMNVNKINQIYPGKGETIVGIGEMAEGFALFVGVSVALIANRCFAPADRH